MVLLSYWKLKDLIDDQGLHNLINHGASKVADGYNCLTGYLAAPDIGNDYDFGLDQPFTVVYWIKAHPTVEPYTNISSKLPPWTPTGWTGWSVHLDVDGRVYILMRYNNATRELWTAVGRDYQDDIYHMIAIRRVAGSSGTIKLWIDDGTEANISGLGYNESMENSADLLIGAFAPSYGFIGEIGNTNGYRNSMGVLIYNHELSDEDLLFLYEKTSILEDTTMKDTKVIY